MLFSILVIACSVFMIAYLRESGKVVELEAQITRMKLANRPDDGIVIEVDFRRH